MKKWFSILAILLFAWTAHSHLWFSTVSESIAADTAEQVYSYTEGKRLKEITFIYDHHDACVGVDLDSSKITIVFDADSFTTTWDTVYNWYAAGKADAQVPGMFRIFTYDTAAGTVSGKLSNCNFVLDSLKIAIFNASDSVATFKAGVIWEDVYWR